jgi:hypothetical protein
VVDREEMRPAAGSRTHRHAPVATRRIGTTHPEGTGSHQTRHFARYDSLGAHYDRREGRAILYSIEHQQLEPLRGENKRMLTWKRKCPARSGRLGETPTEVTTTSPHARPGHLISFSLSPSAIRPLPTWSLLLMEIHNEENSSTMQRHASTSHTCNCIAPRKDRIELRME